MKNVPKEWLDTNGEGAKVVILDSGINMSDCTVYPEEIKSFTPDGVTGDHLNHGTKICELVASQDHDCLGVAPACTLYVGKIVNPKGKTWDILKSALEWVKTVRPDVLCMAVAWAVHSPEVQKQLDEIAANGTIILAAYAHQNPYPHSYPCVISVGTPKERGRAALVVDKENVPQRNGKPFSGTSVSCAVAAGIAACAKSYESRHDRQSFLTSLS